MKIDGPSNTGKTGSAKKAKRSGGSAGSGFAEALGSGSEAGAADGASSAGGAGSAGGVSSIDALLAVQGVPDSTEDKPKRQRARDWGHGVLDRLDDIRLALLAGRIPPERLETLRATIEREREGTKDPNLHALLQDIELRARVELAKYGRR